MSIIKLSKRDTYSTALLIKQSALTTHRIEDAYFNYLRSKGIDTDDIVLLGLEYDDSKKVSAKTKKYWLDTCLPDLRDLGVSTLLVCDGSYFKTLTNQTKAEPHIGYVLDSAYPKDISMKTLLVPNYTSVFYQPENQAKIGMALDTYVAHMQGNYSVMGADIIHAAEYPTRLFDIETALTKLYDYPMITCDTETFSLKHYKAGIGSIAFATSQHEGLSFQVDMKPGDKNKEVRTLLREFFDTYTGTIIYHNANFDLKILVSQLYMKTLYDHEGMLEGIRRLTSKFHCTKILSYLATNSTTGNHLSLKAQAHEFAGNYAHTDITDITRIPVDDLLEYNLVDCLATWFVYNKHYQTVIDDNQLSIYNSMMLPSVKVILQMELVGMPLSMEAVDRAAHKLESDMETYSTFIQQSPLIEDFTAYLQEQAQLKANAKLKKKVKPLADFAGVRFNPGSNPQVQELLYDRLGLPVIDLTDTKQPAVGAKTLQKLMHHTQDKHIKDLIQAFCDYLEAQKMLSTFIEAFKNNSVKIDGWYFLFGNFNLGGTVSGRLSSSSPNLQQIPSKDTEYAKIIKQCFQAPPGWVFVGADFASLEDRISALTTKDPNKLKVYTDGYDGHCLRTYKYFSDQMPDIDPESVSSINSIEDKYPELRQKSKMPTFALTYGGTYHTLVKNLGLSQDEAMQIEANYHQLYKVSDEWVAKQINKAAVQGYVEVAFGLRVRTPMIKKSLWGTDTVPYEAMAESRTAGNALGQSYGLLNNRAAIEVQRKINTFGYAQTILPVAHIHDAQYFLVKEDLNAIRFLNDVLIKAMEWQDLDSIRHPTVGLGGKLSIFYPTWADEHKLPNYISEQEILRVIKESTAA